MCVALWRAVKVEAGDLDPNGPQFTTGLLDVLSTPTTESVIKVFVNIFAPWYSMSVAASEMERPKGRTWIKMLILAIPFYTWIALLVLEFIGIAPGICYVGWTVLFGFFAYGTGIRLSIREKYGIHGNMMEDFFAVMILYPFAAYQMEHHVKNYRGQNSEEHYVQNGHCVSYGKSESCCVPLEETKKLVDPDQRHTNV